MRSGEKIFAWQNLLTMFLRVESCNGGDGSKEKKGFFLDIQRKGEKLMNRDFSVAASCVLTPVSREIQRKVSVQIL